MCADCLHCVEHDYPCQDAFGSNAELADGFAGRADALFGAVEAQKSSGSLHFHFKLFVQRLHQYCTLQEIAELIQKGFADVGEFKNYMTNIYSESYRDADRHKRESMDLENNWPRCDEHSEATNGHRIWGDIKLGRLPKFV